MCGAGERDGRWGRGREEGILMGLDLAGVVSSRVLVGKSSSVEG